MNERIESAKKITWYGLSFMTFPVVWGFINLVDAFIYFNGTQSIFAWIIIFALYFIPYALMVGELGSAFKDESGGVSSWIYRTNGAKLAYYAGWTYWACQITYISGKGSQFLKALSWGIFRNAETYDSFPIIYVQLATLLILLLGCFIANKGLNPLKKLLTVAGVGTFILSILYIIMMFTAPLINPNADYVETEFSFENFIPNFDITFFGSLSVLVFGVGGCEKISPYVNKVKDPSRGFPKSMILLAIMIVVCAVLGTFALGKMFDPAIINSSKDSFNSYVANGPYWAFQKLGEYYNLGDTFLMLYSIIDAICIFAILIVCIDAPLRILLDNETTKDFIPSMLRRKNKYGAYSNGIILVAILAGSIILIQSFGGGAADVLQQVVKLNSICMPLRYLWVFFAYYSLRKSIDTISADYRFVKKQGLAKFFAIWCFIVTAICSIVGMYDENPFVMLLNVITPVVLLLLGVILPTIAKREKRMLK